MDDNNRSRKGKEGGTGSIVVGRRLTMPAHPD